MTAFVTVLLGAGWRYGDTPSTSSLAAASGTAFAVIAVAPDGQRLRLPQRDQTVTRLALGSNPALLVAVAVELALLLAFLGIPHSCPTSWAAVGRRPPAGSGPAAQQSSSSQWMP